VSEKKPLADGIINESLSSANDNSMIRSAKGFLGKNDLEVFMLKRFSLISILFVLLVINSLASAQLFDSIGGTLKDANLGGTLGGAATPPPADTSFLTYIPDPAVSAEVLQTFIETLKASGQVTPEQMAQFESAAKESLTREAMQQFIDQLFVGEGFKLENVGDVLAIYMIASFVVLNDLTNGTTTEQDLAVRDQIVSAFANVPDMKQLSDADKQKTAEGLILFTIFLANDWQQAQQGVEGYDLNTIKGYTKDTLLQMGIDPAQFDFTPQGLVRKGQAGQQPQTPTGTTTPETPQTTTPQTTMPQTGAAMSPEVQAAVDAMTPQQLQEMLPQCQTVLADPEAAKQAAGENAEIIVPMCEAIVAKAGGTTTTTQQTPTTEPTENPTTPNGGTNPLAGGDGGESFVGTFSGNNMTLMLQGSNNAYTGELQFNGTPYPVQATANGANLTGTFTSGSSTFNFTATLQDKALTLVSDGSTFNLQKQ
jgi:hypothetical protein